MVQPASKRLVTEEKVGGHVLTHVTSPGPTKDALDETYAEAFPTSQSITYNTDGTVATVTEDGITTSYTYNTDGTVATDSRTINGTTTTRTYTYTNGNLTGIEAV